MVDKDNMEVRSTTVDTKSSISLLTLTCAIVIVIVIALCAIATTAMGIANAAQQPPLPQIPCMVIGNITINGNEAPVGTVITAKIDGGDRAESTLNVAGLFVLVINGTNADTGKTMAFFVNDLRSDSTLPWESGALHELDFAVFTEEGGSESSSSSASTSTPEITPTPTATATPAMTITPTPIIPPPGMPSMPASFYGTVSISGKPAPVGTVVQAYIGGKECGNITVIKEGEYADGLDRYLAVYGTNEDTGKRINFTVNGALANETAIYASGGVDKQELTASRAGGVSLPSFEFSSAIIAVILVIAVVTIFMVVYLTKIKRRR